jgi:hypothetical protein
MQISIKVEFGPRQGRTRKGLRGVVALVAVALVLPMVVLASDAFPDVLNSNPFHNDIGRVYGARVAAGCGGGNYCPSGTVTREQMAAFLSRVGSRVAFGPYNGNHDITGLDVEVATLTIRAGNVTGGTAFVKVDAHVGAFITSMTGCPCQVKFFIAHHGVSVGLNGYLQLDTLAGTYALDNGAATDVFAVPTGVDQTFKVYATRFAGTGTITGWAEMTAIYAPFGNQGGADIDASSTVFKPASGGGPPGN